jgi:hypothetical protein
MLVRLIVMVSVTAAALSLAACAEMGEAMAASAAQQAAEIAATQAEIATTQALTQLQAATSQMATQAANGHLSLPSLPKAHKGTLIIFLPNAMIIQKNGHRYVFPRENYMQEENTDTYGVSGLPNQ